MIHYLHIFIILYILKITQHTAIIVKIVGNKREYTLSDNSCMSFNHAKPHVLFIMFMFSPA